MLRRTKGRPMDQLSSEDHDGRLQLSMEALDHAVDFHVTPRCFVATDESRGGS